LEHEHLDRATLRRLLERDRTEDQNRSLLHQIAVCPECFKAGGDLLELHRSGRLGLLFGLLDVELAQARAEAGALWDALQKVSLERRLELVHAERPFLNWGLCELLCDLSREEAASDASRALELAELAVAIAKGIEDEKPAETNWLYELRAYAWGHLGNARRTQGNLAAAEEAFEISDQWWMAGEEDAGDVLRYGAVLLHLKGSLRLAQRRFPEALLLLDEAVALYLQGDSERGSAHLAGRVLIKKGYVLIESGQTESAIAAFQEAEGLVDAERDPRLLFSLRHNLVDALTKAGRYEEGRALLPPVQDLARRFAGQLDQIRLRWVEGRIAAGLGETEAALVALSEVRRGFLDQGIGYDAALVSLELAALLLHLGRTAEVRELAAEMIAIFRAQDVHREALAALSFFQTAAARDAATAELAQEVASFLLQARTDAQLRFSPPKG
jgi:tetratricopeptide (TPR) repeat protein